jgi:hypothetical protein|tara:strand:- start:567 stop:812 length:246 start_codon:yes stop_codon:yes gene_type:complete
MPAGYVGNGPAHRDPTSVLEDGAVTVEKLSGAIAAGAMSTTERNALTPSNGWIIYNSTSHTFQGYADGAWIDLHGSYVSIE